MEVDSREEWFIRIEDAIVCGKIVWLCSEQCRLALADASNPFAVARLMHASGKSLVDIPTVCVNSFAMAEKIAVSITEEERSLLDRFKNDAVEIIAPIGGTMPEILGDGFPYIRLRVFEDGLMNEIITHVARPLAMFADAAQDATFADCRKENSDNIVMCCDLQFSNTITIFFDAHRKPVVIDSSGSSADDIAGIIGKHEIAEHRNIPELLQQNGVSRYRPKTPMLIVDIRQVSIESGLASRLGYITFGKDAVAHDASIVKNLSPTGDTVEAAARLYASLKAVDGIGLPLVIVKRLPEDGFGSEINERLRTAAFDVYQLNEILSMCS